jgi:hypothetical protein
MGRNHTRTEGEDGREAQTERGQEDARQDLRRRKVLLANELGPVQEGEHGTLGPESDAVIHGPAPQAIECQRPDVSLYRSKTSYGSAEQDRTAHSACCEDTWHAWGVKKYRNDRRQQAQRPQERSQEEEDSDYRVDLLLANADLR